jgi:two-component system, NarL family, nitrate/nitrite response regulator NarL
MENIKLFIADDHQMFIDGIKALISDDKSIQIIGEANDGNEVFEKLPTLSVDVMLLDIGMTELNGIETAQLISEKYPKIKLIALTMYDDQNRVNKMLKAGVKGYILKNTSKNELLEAIKTVSEGGTYFSAQIVKYTLIDDAPIDTSLISKLTKREIEIIKLIMNSLTNKEIANQLFLSELTINTHRKNAMQKLELKNTASLVKYAMDNNFSDL